MEKRIVSMILLLSVLFNMTACSGSSQFNSLITDFKELYFETTDSISPKYPLAFMETLQSEENENRIKEMKTLLDELNKITPESSLDEYKEITDWYNGLLLLHDLYKMKDSLTFEDNEKIFIEIVLIQQIRRNYNR